MFRREPLSPRGCQVSPSAQVGADVLGEGSVSGMGSPWLCSLGLEGIYPGDSAGCFPERRFSTRDSTRPVPCSRNEGPESGTVQTTGQQPQT